MTIPRTWPNGVRSFPLSPASTPMLASSDLAVLDGALQSALDKSVNGDTIYAPITIGTGASIRLVSPTSSVASGANNITTTSGGRAVCGHGDWPTFETPQTFEHFVSVMEQFSNLSESVPAGLFPITGVNWEWFLGLAASQMSSPYGGTYEGQTPDSGAIIPVTRMHDGAVVSAVTAYFSVSPGRSGLPGRYPGINLWQFDPFLNVLTSLTGGWKFFPTASTLGAYCNGTVLSVAISSGGSYGSPPSVSFTAAPGGGTTATGTAVLTGSAVSSITITNPGAGYATTPSVTFGSGSASATAYLAGTPNAITASTSFTVNAGKYLYFAGILDEDYANETLVPPNGAGPAVPNQWPGFALTLTAADMRPQ